MKKIVINKEIFENIKSGKQTQVILNDDLNVNEKIILKFENEEIVVEITAKAFFETIDDCLKIIPIDLFGFKDNSAAIKYCSKKQVNAYRIKYDNTEIEKLDDPKLLSLIKQETLKKNNIGHSSSNVYEVELLNGEPAIIKTQRLSNRNDLYAEYERIKWLQGKCNVPKIYYYNEVNSTKFLLMEKFVGKSAHKTENYAYKIGKVLRKIHDINISDCSFRQNSVDVLAENALNNIDIICPQVQEKYCNMTKEDIISFIKNNKPKDEVLVHGDYSLPNILIDTSGKVGLIDLGDVSISTKYFDFFYLKKSMIRNKQEEYIPKLLEGYGIEKLDENYLKWVEIIDKALF